ncbi:MAG: hypothetical protein KIH02_08125 [Parabacteroides sp.]|nr:hypothetical protein [Parabacteroides sp.]
MAELKPYNPNKPTISIDKGDWLDRMAKAGIPLTRALKYFRDNPEGKALKTVKLTAEDVEPTGFYSTYMNDGDALDYVTEAIMLGMPMPGPKSSKKVMTPKGEKTYYVNQRIPELDVERNQKLKRLFDETNDINWRESDYSPWYDDDYVPEVGDTRGGSKDYHPNGDINRYESKSIDPDDFNNLMAELEAEGAIEAADDYKFDVNSQEYADAKQTKADLDKIYSEMNDDTALLTNEGKFNDDLENRASNEFWKKHDEIADKYISPDWKGTRYLYDDAKRVTPEQFDVEKYRKYLTEEEINKLKESLPEIEKKRELWPEMADKRIAEINANIEKGYTELPKPFAVQAFPNYEAMSRYRAEIDALPKDLEYTKAEPRPASDVFDFVANDPELMAGDNEMYGQYPSLHDDIYIYKPETAYRPAEDLVNASISRYTEPYRITMRDFDQMTNLVNDLRDPTLYNKNWTANLKQEISDLKENELLTAQDKERMKETVDYYAEKIVNEPDPDRRKTLLKFFKNDLDAAGLIYDDI